MVDFSEQGTQIFFDKDGDLAFSDAERQAMSDFNEDNTMGLVNLGTSKRNPDLYAVYEKEGEGEHYITIAKPSGSHGTHVAGIAAAYQPESNVIGAAPKADLISIKVCQKGCSSSAIVKGSTRRSIIRKAWSQIL